MADEKTQMLRVANAAMEELIFLVHNNEPFWTKSSNDVVGYALVPERYMEKFPRIIYVENPYVYEESSKDSTLVMAGAMELVEIFFDSDEWADIFPTIVSQAETVQVFDEGSLENPSGALQLMREEVHVLSPLVPSRESFFLRYCQHIESTEEWFIVDVSLDSSVNGIPHSPVKKFPSGCRIRELPNGCSMVTWVQHVKVDQRFQLDMLVRDIVRNNLAYCAKRCLLELQRTFEKKACSAIGYGTDIEGLEREVKSQEGRESVINLSNRMVGNFCKILNTQGIENLLDESVALKTSIKVVARRSTIPGEPEGMIVVCIASFWLPEAPQDVLVFLRDELRRREWDVLAGGRPMRKKAHITINSYNHISMLKTYMTARDNTMVLEESSIDELGGYVVYAPITKLDVHNIVNGEDSSEILILPSGFTVSRDGSEDNEGSLITMCLQIVVSEGGSTTQVSKANLFAANSIFMSTLTKIKIALDCFDY